MGVVVTRTIRYNRKGVGISYTDVEYADSTSNSVAPTTGWQTTAPAWQNGHYIWTRTHIVYTDGTDQYSNPVCIPSGKGIASIVEQYYQSTSATELVGGQWVDNTAPAWVSGKYIWTRSKITYTDGTVQYTDAINPTGQKGDKGDTGVGISSVTEYYLASSSSSGVTTSTPGWTTDPTATAATMTSTKKYLWNYERINYTDGTHADTTPARIGTYGDRGVGITSITEYYLATSAVTGVTRSTSGWTTSIQTVTSTNKYLWNYEKVTYTDGTTANTDPVIIGVYGDQGPGVNPNILLRTIFDNGIAPVKEAWSANWSYVNIDGASDTVIGGRKSIRINASTLAYDIDFTQDVYGKVKANTWYTLSFNYFSTAQWRTYLWPNTDSYACIDTTEWYIDGERSTSVPINGQVLWPSNWQGNRHSITFKTKSSFPTAYFKIIFRAMAGGQVAICMPKLEEGKVATAYIAHEDDLKGEQSTTPGPRGYRGPALRGPQDWLQLEEGYQFYKGDESNQEPYEDFVVYNGYYYKCIKTHTKAASRYPYSGSEYWVLSDKLAMIAANVLFAKHGYFGSAIISGDWLISTNGMVDNTVYNNGATYNGIIAYSLFNENNPSGDPITKFSGSGPYTLAASDTTKNIGTVTLEEGKTYKLTATGKCESSSGSYYIRLRYGSNGATNTPVMINGTSDVTRSGVFTANASGTYYIEFYNTSGLTGTVTNVVLDEMNFAPTFALDLLTGTTYQRDGVFTGFIRKGKTKITTSNINNYKRSDIATATVLDFDKCGSFIELSTGTASYFSLPLLSSAIASRYTAAQKDRIRSFIGTKLLVYNNSGVNLSITYKWTTSGGTYGYTLYNGNCVELECPMGKDDGDNGTEVIYWNVNKTAEPV